MTGARSAGSPPSSDREAVVALIGREPLAGFEVAVRCPFGAPAVVRNAPRDDRGRPFPTRDWLTCRALAEAVSRLEAARRGPDARVRRGHARARPGRAPAPRGAPRRPPDRRLRRSAPREVPARAARVRDGRGGLAGGRLDRRARRPARGPSAAASPPRRASHELARPGRRRGAVLVGRGAGAPVAARAAGRRRAPAAGSCPPSTTSCAAASASPSRWPTSPAPTTRRASWYLDLAARVAPREPDAWDPAVALDAAFAGYSRQAIGRAPVSTDRASRPRPRRPPRRRISLALALLLLVVALVIGVAGGLRRQGRLPARRPRHRGALGAGDHGDGAVGGAVDAPASPGAGALQVLASTGSLVSPRSMRAWISGRAARSR